VASSGLESFLQHGFLPSSPANSATRSSFSLLSFLRESLVSYAHLNLHFFQTAHQAVSALRALPKADRSDIEYTLSEIIRIDDELEQMLLNHVTRRASKAQGIALLTLYSRAFAALPSQDVSAGADSSTTKLMDALKIATRSKSSIMQGHLPVCFAVLCAALGLSLGNARQLVSG
jgi:urease accessory protein